MTVTTNRRLSVSSDSEPAAGWGSAAEAHAMASVSCAAKEADAASAHASSDVPPSPMEQEEQAGAMSHDSLAHLHLQRLAARFSPAAVTNVSYDDGNALLLVTERNILYSWPVNAGAADGDAIAAPNTCVLTEGPVLATRFSLDGSLLAIQRTSRDVEFVNRDKGSVFWQRCRRGEPLIGFFWVNTPECHLALVTAAGLELYQLLPDRNGLRLTETKEHRVDWFKFTHETRLVLLASESLSGVRAAGYQFAASGVLRLPKMDLVSQAIDRNRARVGRKNVHLLTMYGCMFCAHVDYACQQLRLHRFYRDALVLQHTFPLYSTKVALSVVDNALMLHDVHTGVVLVLDIHAGEEHPLASPLPPRLPPHPTSSPDCDSPDADPSSSPDPAAAGPTDLYTSSWSFECPDLIVDWQRGAVFRQRLDLAAIVASCSNRPALVAFLQRRRQDLHYAPHADPRSLSIFVTSSLIQDRVALPIISQVFELLCSTYRDAMSNAQLVQGRLQDDALLPRSPAVSPEDVATYVFAPLEAGTQSDAPFVIAALTEYLRCCETTRLTCPASLPTILFALLRRERRLHELPAWVPALSRPPGKQVALEVAKSAKEHPPAMQVVQDLLHRPSTHEVYVTVLLQEGRVLDALRYARKNGVESVPPMAFLDAALKTRDPCMFATVYRFCCEFVPAFTTMSSYVRYTDHLHELCCAREEPSARVM